jgi:TAG lipase/steryl ester hydrolase/phospholipase A2/LPA acyltransferase
MSVYHIGVVKALYEQDLLPKIICGASAGAIVAGLICTRSLDRLEDLFDPYYIKFDCFQVKEKSFTL